ncbi:CDP-diacylglycerol--glycerol-3-phosphate 3-phosphatidyltransferase [Bartonella sp. DGB1]|uniref:CDP-diacylglycerol--glycerol-3-phosphate 3-phosphatidyltransferase n=1 Tax=Bartonella sp. DGB1 TaxID=3239807 RepID=UPI003526BD69
MAKNTYSLPNILTYLRIVIVPLFVACYFLEGKLQTTDTARLLSLIIFAFACVTDFLDGYLARIWKQTSNIGRIFDPIADKLIIVSALLLLAANGTIAGWSLWAAIIILCREILVSGLREYLSDIHINIPVSNLAKYKTTIQMIAIGCLLIGPTGDSLLNLDVIFNEKNIFLTIGLTLLWVAALFTLITGWSYLKQSLSSINEE